MRKKSSALARATVAPHLVWSAIFIVVPLFVVVYYAFTNSSGGFTLENIQKLKEYIPTFRLSIWYGLLSTVICLLIAYPFAYFISQKTENKQRMMMMLVMLPMWMNLLIRTYSWMLILERNGILNKLLGLVGMGNETGFLNTGGAVVLGMVYNYLPYMILPIYSIMSRLDQSVINAVQDLGGNRANVLRRVIFPLSRPGVVSGITMVFVPSVSTFYISQKLGGGSFLLIGDAIESQFQSANNFNLGASLSLVLMVLILISMAIMNRFTDSDDNGGMIV